jgi:multidrug efflux pump subunit AcrB
MRAAHFFIDHPRYATVLSVFIALIGLAMMVSLPIAQYPSIVPPTIQIEASYPGASADTIARTVATPLEQAVNGVEDMSYISSQSTSDGHLTITVIFRIGSNPNIDLMLTRNRVEDTLSRLPEEVQLQGVHVKKTIQALVLGVHVYSPDGSRSPEYLSNYMLHVRDEIARIPGVADFQLFGERQYAMRIWIDPDKAASYNISASDILSALRAQNAQVSAGVLNNRLSRVTPRGKSTSRPWAVSSRPSSSRTSSSNPTATDVSRASATSVASRWARRITGLSVTPTTIWVLPGL